MENYISEETPILDGEIIKIDILNINYTISIDVYIKTIQKSTKFIKLSFQEIQSYGLYWSSEYSFYIERYKLVIKEGDVYISFDPDESSEGISESDNDFIRAKTLEIYESKDNVNFLKVNSQF